MLNQYIKTISDKFGVTVTNINNAFNELIIRGTKEQLLAYLAYYNGGKFDESESDLWVKTDEDGSLYTKVDVCFS